MYSQRPNGVPGMSARTKGPSLLAPFKNQDISLGSLTKIHITHISNPEKFHVQLDSSTDTLEKLVDKIHAVYGGVGLSDYVLKSYSIGQACIAMFDEDNSWYRAKITGISGDKLIEVLFVDYGNTELVEPQKIKAITPDLLDLPAQSVICALSGVAPSQGFWPPEHIAQFEDIALAQSFTACFKSKRKEDQMYLVKLISDSGEMINETFGAKTNSVCLEEDVSFAKRQIQIDSSGDNVQVTVARPQNGVGPGGDCGSVVAPPVVRLCKGEALDVSVIYAETPSRFFCQAVKYESVVNEITQKLLQYERMPETANILPNQSQGTLCAAKSREDNLWYRARITAVEGTLAHVFFVDFGNSEEVKFNHLKILTPELQNFPFCALECMLGNVRSVDNGWTDQAIEDFEMLVYDKEIEMKILDVEGPMYIVTLTDSVEGSDIGQKLIVAKHATSSQASQTVNPYPKLDIPIPSKSQIFISWTDTPEHFWVQLADNQDMLDNLTENLQNHCEAYGLPASKVNPGKAVLAKFTDDEAWYRGVIQSITGSKATVMFVDYGNTDTLPTSKLLKVPPEFLKTPSLAVLCKFNNIQPTQASSSWIEDAKTILDDFTVDGAVAKFLDKDGDKFIVELYVGQENVEDHLVKAGVASRKSGQKAMSSISSAGYPNSVSLAPKQLEKGYVSHVDSLHQFWCQLSKHTSSLDELMEKLEAYYSQGQGQSVTPIPGSACVAKYSADEAWYRAEVVKFDGNIAKVFFVDYGNCDTVPPTSVCKLAAEFLTLPKQAMQCRLPLDNPDPSLTDKFQEIVEEKEFVMKVQAVSGSIHKVDLLDDNQSVAAMLSSGTLPRQPVLPPPRVQFKPNKVQIGHPITAYASCIVSPGKLYLQMAGTDDQLNDISQKLKSYCSTCDIVPEIQEGDGCAGLFAEDSEWYRAKVMTIRGSEVKVLFVDYGNAEYLQKDGLRPLPAEVVDVPPFGIECSLDDLAPLDGSDWTPESTEFLESLILDQELNCGFVSSAAVIITIAGEDVGDKLVDAGQAKRISAPPVPKEYDYPSKPDGEVKGYITHIDPDGVFYVQLSTTEREIIKLAELMQREGKNASKLSPKVSVEKGLACISKFKVDKNWYRVRIESVNGSNANVRFVDYGNCEEENSDDFKQLTTDMMKAPVQALPCRLKDLSDWNQDLQDRLNEMSDELTFTFVSDTHPFLVDVKTKRGKDVADLIMNPPKPRVYAKQNKPTTDIQAYISHVEGDNSFYIQLSDQTDIINELSTTLAEFPAEEVPEKLTTGYACAAMFSEDQAWYRAIVTKLGPKVHVHFVDFGNGDDLPVDKLKELPEDLLDIPPYALQCKIDGVKNWSEAAKNLFDSYTEKEMTVKFLSESTPYSVELTCEEHDVARILNRAEVTAYLKHTINNQQLHGTVCHTEQGGKFYLHLHKNDEILDNLGAELQDYFGSDQSEVAYNLQKGQPCCAKFSEDNSWYRAIVDEVTADKVHVHFVDFGNVEEADPSDVKFMEKQFMKHPPLAFECQLNNAGKWTEKKQQKFTEMTEGKELNIEFVTNTVPYMVNVTRSLADVLQEEANESVVEETEEKAADDNEAEALSEFQPQSPSNGPGFICHTESDGIFYVQIESEEEKLTNLSEKLQEHYVDTSASLDEVLPGKICVAKFTEDDMWYRAKVEEVKGEEVKVRFVDYGNADTVTADRIKKLKAEDVSHPPLAYKCNLQGADNWTEEMVTEFQTLTDDQTLTVKFVEADEDFSVELVTDNGKNIFTLLKQTGKSEAEQPFSEDAEGIEANHEESKSSLQENESSEKSKDENGQEIEGTDQQDSGLVESLPETDSSVRDETDSQGVEETISKTETGAVESTPKTDQSNVVFIQNKLKEGSRLSVTVSHAIHPNDFYIQPETSLSLLEKLTAEMYDYYNGLAEGEELVVTPAVHEPVAVLYSEDESWYRARIEAISDENCDVFYVDHGNMESVSVASLRRLCPKFAELPIQAVECSLAGVQPTQDSWSVEAIQQFTELTQDKELLADIIKVGENGNCLVHLLNQGLSVSQELISKHHGVSADTPVSISKKIKRVFSDSQSPAKRIKMNELTDSILEDDEEGKRLKCISCELHKQESIHAVVSYTDSPSKFWCQFSFATDALVSMMDQLQTAYSSGDNQRYDQDLSVDDIGVMLATDDKYYRGAVENIDGERLRVRLVDYGRSEDVSVDKFFTLKDEFYKFPSQAARCCLHNLVSPGNTWQPNSCDRFSELVKDKELIMFVKKVLVNCLAVELFDGESSIRETMVTESLAKYDDTVESSDEEEFDRFGVTVPEIQIFDESTEVRKDYSDLEQDTEYEIQVDMETFDPTMFTATVQYDEKTQKILDSIAVVMGKREDKQKDDGPWGFNVGDPCLAFHDEAWGRARIVKIENENVQVYYVDVGNSEDVNEDAIAEISQQFLAIPPQLITCRLGEILPVSGDTWSNEALQFMKDYIKEKTISAYILSKGDDEVYSVSLVDSSDIDSPLLNKLLVETELARVIPNSQLEIQLEMESDLNNTDKMGELEASFQDVSFLRENSMDEDLMDEKPEEDADQTDNVLDGVERKGDDAEAESQDKTEADTQIKASTGETEADSQNVTQKDETEAKTESDGDENEAAESEQEVKVSESQVTESKSEIQASQSDITNSDNPSDKTEADALECEKENEKEAAEVEKEAKNEKEATEVENEVTESDKEATEDGNKNIKKKDNEESQVENVEKTDPVNES